MKPLFTLLVLLLTNAAFSQAALTAKFTFTKKPPNVALIYFEDGKETPEANTKVDQKNQAFDKKLYVAKSGGEISFVNSDNIDHNIYADDKATGIKFDKGLGNPGSSFKQKVEWGAGKVIKIGCMIHPKMKSYVASLNTKYFKIVEFDRSKKEHTVKMDGLPPEVKQLKVWMPKYNEVSVELSSGTKTAELKRKGKSRGSLELTR